MTISSVMMHRRISGIVIALTLTGCTVAHAPTEDGRASSSASPSSAVEVIADHLAIPWDVAFLPSGDFLVTERGGQLLRIGADRKQFTIAGVLHRGEGGLMGIVLHPQYSQNHWLYLMLTTDEGGVSTNRVERYVFNNDQLTERTTIIDNIPAAIYHDGGRLAFGPDGDLYITTGDATKSDLAQRTDSLAGKILRLHDDGSIPADNPFGNAVYSYGHRNPQGLTWDSQGQLWSTEHGRSGVDTGFDELNSIQKGGNYGWPVVQGPEKKEGMIAPVLQSGPTTTWAPASAEYRNGSVFFGGLKGEAVFEAELRKGPQLSTHLLHQFGRIRTVRFGPDGFLYLTTSNRDGRGKPADDDDKLIRIDPTSLSTDSSADAGAVNTEQVNYGPAVGYLALPKEPGKHPALVLIHEWWGLNDNMQWYAEEFARQGYVALAVDLYKGRSTKDAAEAKKLAGEVREHLDAASDNLRSAVAYLTTRPEVDTARLGSVGWCFGGGWSYQMAKNDMGVKATVMYYGQFAPEDDLSMMKAHIIGHFGENDTSIPVDDVKAFRAKLQTLSGENQIFIYPNVGHGFARELTTESARAAWDRTLQFLREEL